MKRRLLNVWLIVAVCLSSLALLVYVAGGKAARTYEQFTRDAALSQGELVQSSVEGFLRQDLPLRQFAGFKALTDPLVQDDTNIAAIWVVNEHGDPVFANPEVDTTPVPTVSATQNDIVLPLRGKFDTAGQIIVKLKPDRTGSRVDPVFRPLWMTVFIVTLAFALVMLRLELADVARRRTWTAVSFAVAFSAIAVAITIALVPLYADGASAKGKALVQWLGGELDDISDYHLNYEDFSGINDFLSDFSRINKEVSSIALIADGTILKGTDPSKIGREWRTPDDAYSYTIDITKPGTRSFQVAMAMPKGLVYWQIVSSLRNTAALFVASGFFAYFFLELARALAARGGANPRELALSESAVHLGLIKPVFFIATFVEQLNSAFLPQYVQSVVHESGVSAGFTSLPFTIFYLCFAASLIPAGWAEGRFGAQRITWGGLFLVSSGLMLMAGELGFAGIVVARALSGAGQGIVFIGVQSYVLRATDIGSRTRGSSIIVVGFQAGMISGMAIGSLLVSQLGSRGMFELGACIACLTGLYTLLLVPGVRGGEGWSGPTGAGIWRSIVSTLGDFRFVCSITLIGLPAKAVLTGVVLFALPLVLSKLGYAQEDIGQVTMIYAATVIAASAWASARTDNHGATSTILCWGALLSGAGLLLVSSAGWETGFADVGWVGSTTTLVVFGVATVGVAHGLINAPIITHVTGSRISARLGAGPVAATYRFLERIGHTLGPIVIGQLFSVAGASLMTLGWIGVGLITLGLLFALSSLDRTNLEPETV